MLGAVTSRLMVTDCSFVPPALVAEQVRVAPVVSEVIVVGPQSLVFVTVDSASVTVQLTSTSLTYQPLLPSVPLTFGVITGGVVSDGGGGAETVRLMVNALPLLTQSLLLSHNLVLSSHFTVYEYVPGVFGAVKEILDDPATNWPSSQGSGTVVVTSPTE